MSAIDDIEALKAIIRDVPDFPKPGIVFKDITPLLQDAEALKLAGQLMADPFRDAGVDAVVGVESRGFIFGPLVALELGVGFVLARKQGKLPWHTVSRSYTLEYGEETIEMHRDAVQSGQRVLLIDDLLATGGTAAATARLIEDMQATVVGCSFLIELEALQGRKLLADLEVRTVISC
jgi:adenine phosphoribosyltransferase